MDFSALRSHLDAEYGLLIPALAAADAERPGPDLPGLDHHRSAPGTSPRSTCTRPRQSGCRPGRSRGRRTSVDQPAGGGRRRQLDRADRAARLRTTRRPCQTWYRSGSVGRILDPADGAGDRHPPDRRRAGGRPAGQPDRGRRSGRHDRRGAVAFRRLGEHRVAGGFPGAFDQVDSRIARGGRAGPVLVRGRDTDTAWSVGDGAERRTWPRQWRRRAVPWRSRCAARWLWNRGDDRVPIAGDATLAGQFKRLMAVATQ